MMLDNLPAIQAIALPVVLALVLIVLLRRTAHPVFAAAALLLGGRGSFRINEILLSRMPAILPEGQLLATTPAQAWGSGFLEAAIPEEFAKGIVLIFFIAAGSRAHGTKSGPLVGGMVGLGFAMFENLAYAATEPGYRVMAVFSHGAWGVILGWLLQQAIFSPRLKPLKVLLAFIPTILLHGLMDTFIFLMDVIDVRYGNDLTAEGVPGSALGLALALMLTTMLISLGELAWATVIVWRLRRAAMSSATAMEPDTSKPS